MNRYELVVYDGKEWATRTIEASAFTVKEKFIIFHDVDGKNFYGVQNEYWMSVERLGAEALATQ